MVKLLLLRGDTYRRFPLPVLQKLWITRERWQLDEKHMQNTDSKSGSAYRMVKLLQLGGTTRC
jgi:hypothetical protein